MSKKYQLKKGIDLLSKDIAVCEQAFKEVLKQKIQNNKPCQNDPSREVELFVTGPPSKKLPTAIVKPESLFGIENPSDKTVDVFENGDGTVKVIVERKSCPRLVNRRTRSSSNIQSSTVRDDEKTCRSSNKVSMMSERKRPGGAASKKGTPTPRKQSWGQVLDNKQIKPKPLSNVKPSINSQIQKKKEKSISNAISGTAPDKKRMSQEVLPKHAVGNAHPATRVPCVPSKPSPGSTQQGDKTPVVTALPNSSSANKDGGYSTVTASSTSSISYYRSSTVETEPQQWRVQAASRVRATDQEPFALFNPVRTLNFLIKELHGMVKKNSMPAGVTRVLHDMEHTLARIPPEQGDKDLTRGQGDARYLPTALPSPHVLQELQANVERMEMSSRQMQTTCEALRSERDKLKHSLKKKEGELDAALHLLKERETSLLKLKSDVAAVGLKAEEYCQTIAEMTKSIMSLRETNEELTKKQCYLKTQLQETKKESDKLQLELQQKTAEQEKLIVQLTSKDAELQTNQQQLVEMKALMRDQLNSLLKAVRSGMPGHWRSPSDSTTPTGSGKEAPDRPQPRLHTSSPISSAGSSQLGVSPSWHKISRIVPQVAPAQVSLPELSEIHDSQESYTIAGPGRNKDKQPASELPLSQQVYKTLNQEDSGVGNEATPTKSTDDLHVMATTSEEEVEVLVRNTKGAPAAYVSENLREMLDRLHKQSVKLGLPKPEINIPEPPVPFSGFLYEPVGLSQVSEPTGTEESNVYASLSEPENTALRISNI